jgi:hypothetical protein
MSRKEVTQEDFRNIIITSASFAVLGCLLLAFLVKSENSSSPYYNDPAENLNLDDEEQNPSQPATPVVPKSNQAKPTTEPQQNTPSKGELDQILEDLKKKGYMCRTIYEGDWLTQMLREGFGPGIDQGPYALVHRDGRIDRYDSYDQLPSAVFPNEQFCVEVDDQSSIPPTIGSHGVIFQAPNLTQLAVFKQQSLQIRAALRSKHGF